MRIGIWRIIEENTYLITLELLLNALERYFGKGYESFLEMAKNKTYPFGYNKKKNKEKLDMGIQELEQLILQEIDWRNYDK